MRLQPLDLLAILFIELRILLLMKFDILYSFKDDIASYETAG